MPTSKKHQPNPHRGGSFDDFLKEEGVLEEVEAEALKRVIALTLDDLMKKHQMKKSFVAQRMRTSRAAVARLLDPSNTSVTLSTLSRAAKVFGQRVKIEFVPVGAVAAK
ncbi:MAG: helix-turn-helix transcriptional regulator [Verrucomicrobiota bacterium]